MLRSDLCDYSDAYIIVKGRASVRGNNNANRINKNLTLENNDPFKSCISKISNTFVNNAEDLEIIMPMYNLLEHSDNYSITSRSLWNLYKDKINDDANENNAANNRINNNKTMASKSFEYKTKLIGSMPNNRNILDTRSCCYIKIIE